MVLATFKRKFVCFVSPRPLLIAKKQLDWCILQPICIYHIPTHMWGFRLLTTSGLFSVNSFFLAFSHLYSSIPFDPTLFIWKSKAPSKVKNSAWLVASSVLKGALEACLEAKIAQLCFIIIFKVNYIMKFNYYCYYYYLEWVPPIRKLHEKILCGNMLLKSLRKSIYDVSFGIKDAWEGWIN